ncbi:hypothetical protein Hanom_Chr07g00584041 [Helianthus anomalus]
MLYNSRSSLFKVGSIIYNPRAFGEVSCVFKSTAGVKLPLCAITTERNSSTSDASLNFNANVERPFCPSPVPFKHANVIPFFSIFVSFISGKILAFKISL